MSSKYYLMHFVWQINRMKATWLYWTSTLSRSVWAKFKEWEPQTTHFLHINVSLAHCWDSFKIFFFWFIKEKNKNKKEPKQLKGAGIVNTLALLNLFITDDMNFWENNNMLKSVKYRWNKMSH